MRKILWMLLLLGVYIWLMSSGRDQMVIEQGKNLYKMIVFWFDDAELDFQIGQQPSKSKKKARRWD